MSERLSFEKFLDNPRGAWPCAILQRKWTYFDEALGAGRDARCEIYGFSASHEEWFVSFCKQKGIKPVYAEKGEDRPAPPDVDKPVAAQDIDRLIGALGAIATAIEDVADALRRGLP